MISEACVQFLGAYKAYTNVINRGPCGSFNLRENKCQSHIEWFISYLSKWLWNTEGLLSTGPLHLFHNILHAFI